MTKIKLDRNSGDPNCQVFIFSAVGIEWEYEDNIKECAWAQQWYDTFPVDGVPQLSLCPYFTVGTYDETAVNLLVLKNWLLL